ncbi:hypothetical protein ACFUC1_10500 [Pedococcus sp. NPDC057267]|uniref:hypothetical protein n=1 Tax=Pedococcus sp. NPDC057267 TaxID=3346077 RepID=UPI00363EBE4E
MGLPDEDKPTGYRYANGKLKADFEIIRTLAHNRGATWTEKATESHAKVASTTLTANSFSGIESCRDFGTVYAAAKQIYEDTLKGVEEDVKEYQEKLLQVARHLEDKDNRASDVFAGLATSDPSRRQDLHSDAQNKHANASKEAEHAEAVQDEAVRQSSAADQHGAGQQPAGQQPGVQDGAPPAPATGDNTVGGGAPPAPAGDSQTQVKASR